MAKKEPNTKKLPGLRIKTKSGTFRRAGLTFSEQPVEKLLSELSKEQVAALKDEPLLSVEQIEIDTVETETEA
ncbi:MAG TPA: HI1506-related protein [Acidiferrobacterales bacterium]|nr:HI1506-related protein [Acidiferrobacterales bacterium]